MRAIIHATIFTAFCLTTGCSTGDIGPDTEADDLADSNDESHVGEAEQALSCTYTWKESRVITTQDPPVTETCIGYNYAGYYVQCSPYWQTSRSTTIEETFRTTDCCETREIIDSRTISPWAPSGTTWSPGSCGSTIYDPIFQSTSGCRPH